MGYDEIVSELNAVSAALAADDTSGLDASLDRLNAQYDRVKSAERSRIARLQVARTESDLSSDERETLNEFERWFMTTYFGRGALLAGGDLYLLDPAEADSDDLRIQADELAQREGKLGDATSETVDVLEGVMLPPRIGILSFSSVSEAPTLGDTVQLELLLRNVGDSVASGVVATVTAGALSAETTTDVGDLPPQSDRLVRFEFDAAASGAIEFAVSIDSDTAGFASDSTSVIVLTKRSLVETVVGTLEALRDRVEAEVENRGAERSVTSKLEAAIKSLDRVRSEIDRDRRKQADNAINTAINQIEALLNSIDAGRGNGNSLPSGLETALQRQADLSRIHLLDAIDAPIGG